MHNGQIRDFEKLRRPLQVMLSDTLYSAQRGTTDSELLFLLTLNNSLDQEPQTALIKTVETIEDTARKIGIDPLVRLTAAFSNGSELFAVRYSSDAISPTLYISNNTVRGGICLASEPLDENGPNWLFIPANQFVRVCDGDFTHQRFIDHSSPKQNSELAAE